MGYQLGIDIGASVAVVATHRDGVCDVSPINGGAGTVPTLIWVAENGEHVHGSLAEARSATDPERVARAFINRVGDDTPIVMGGMAVSAERLMALFVRSLVADVALIEGEPPTGLVATHPADWGDFRIESLAKALRDVGLDVLEMVPGPVAAATHHAGRTKVPDGVPVAVYDLGGSGFRASVVRSGPEGWVLIGPSKSLDRLGGHDFDHLLFEHLLGLIDCDLSELPDTEETRSAVARIRNDVTKAKEALSLDSVANIPVALRGEVTQVRVARSEFERMIRPSVAQTLVVLDQAIASAGVEASDLHTVLLVGGSSRIPLVSQVVGSHVASPVAVDAHPAHVMALGAAARAGSRAAVVKPPPNGVPPVTLVTLRDAAGQTLLFDAGETIIGRQANGERCAVLDDPTVSARHAALRVSDYDVDIVDLGSTNGTWVNRQRVTRAALTDGDLLEFGDYSIFTVELGRG